MDGSELSPFLMALSSGLAALCRCVGKVSAGLPCLLQRQERQQCGFSMFPIPMLLCARKGFNPSILASPLCCSQGPAPSPCACHDSLRPGSEPSGSVSEEEESIASRLMGDAARLGGSLALWDPISASSEQKPAGRNGVALKPSWASVDWSFLLLQNLP